MNYYKIIQYIYLIFIISAINMPKKKNIKTKIIINVISAYALDTSFTYISYNKCINALT